MLHKNIVSPVLPVHLLLSGYEGRQSRGGGGAGHTLGDGTGPAHQQQETCQVDIQRQIIEDRDTDRRSQTQGRQIDRQRQLQEDRDTYRQRQTQKGRDTHRQIQIQKERDQQKKTEVQTDRDKYKKTETHTRIHTNRATRKQTAFPEHQEHGGRYCVCIIQENTE